MDATTSKHLLGIRDSNYSNRTMFVSFPEPLYSVVSLQAGESLKEVNTTTKRCLETSARTQKAKLSV